MEEQTSFNILIVCLNCVFTLKKDIYYYYYYYHIVHLESQTLSCTHPLVQPVFASILWSSILLVKYPSIKYPLILDRYFVPLSRWKKSSAIIMGSGSTLVILFNFQKSIHTLLEPSFFLIMTMGDANATLMVSLLPSLAYCPLHSVALPSWLTQGIRLTTCWCVICQLHSVLNHISFSICISVKTSAYIWVNSFSICH